MSDLIVDIKHSLLDLLVDLLGRVDEGFLHVGSRLGRGLHEHQPVLPGKGLSLFLLHLSSGLQITESYVSLLDPCSESHAYGVCGYGHYIYDFYYS